MTEEQKPECIGDPAADEDSTTEANESTSIRDQLDESLREKDQFRAMAQRAQADLINYRRRATEEQGALRRTANSDLILKVLSVVDDLERALALVPEDAVATGWLEGLRLVQRNLNNLLDSEGVTKIEAKGKPFEPREHEAILYEETDDSPDGMIIRVIRDGYRLHDRLLRAAQVTVSKASESQNQSEITQEEI